MKTSQPARRLVICTVAVVAVTAAILLSMGREPICKCGYVKLWHGVVQSSENSQHITDWYTPSHVIHGFLFYGLFFLVGRRWPIAARLLAATVLESGWEILENSPLIINRYREGTISLDYYGDSVINSVSDITSMIVGFVLVWRLPVKVTVSLAIAAELFVGYMIRDNLTLNIIQLIFQSAAITRWQGGG